MSFIISDGSGRAYKAAVNSENKLMVMGVVSTVEHYVNHDKEAAYQVLFEQTVGVDDGCIFYMKNSDTNNNLVVEGINLYVSAACEVYIKISNTGTRNNVTSLTPANLNAGSTKVAEGTFEKGADLGGGSASLSGGTEIYRYKFIAETQATDFNFKQDIILPINKTLTVWCDTANVNILCMIPFNYHNTDLS